MLTYKSIHETWKPLYRYSNTIMDHIETYSLYRDLDGIFLVAFSMPYTTKRYRFTKSLVYDSNSRPIGIYYGSAFPINEWDGREIHTISEEEIQLMILKYFG